MSEPRMTRDEWTRHEALRECAEHGHEYENLIRSFTGDLLAVFCSRCGRRWTVVSDQ